MSGGEPSVSVVVCAYTQLRWDDLKAAIESVERQSVSSELIVVIDHEDVLLRRARDEWPQHRIMPNALQQGLSGARNTGIQLAEGDFVVFLDDDASASSDDWLQLLLEPYSDPAVIAVGGSATPIWPHQGAPVTLPPELLWIVGCTYEGQPTTLAEVRNLMGCNMSFRRPSLIAVGGFNPDMGRVGTLPLGCEETEACIRMSALQPGSRILFEPSARVNHRVTENRESWRYLLRRGYGEGVSKAALSRMLGMRSSLNTEASYAGSVLPRGVIRELFAGRPLGAIAIILTLAVVSAGYVRGSIRPAARNSTDAGALRLEGSAT